MIPWNKYLTQTKINTGRLYGKKKKETNQHTTNIKTSNQKTAKISQMETSSQKDNRTRVRGIFLAASLNSQAGIKLDFCAKV